MGKAWMLGVIGFGIGMGQLPGAVQAQSAVIDGTAPKAIAFEVISIRQNVSGVHEQTMGATADGYRMTNLPLILPLLTAFPPQAGGMFTPDRLQGLPDWVAKEHYDFEAKIAANDRADWQNPARQKEMLPILLQEALAERCKLAAHRETKQSSVYFLVLGKSGPKFAETNPEAAVPTGVSLPGAGGAVLVRSNDTLNLYGTSLSFFVTMLTGLAGDQPIVDKTGLTGRYNITVKSIISHKGQAPGTTEASDPRDSIFAAMEALGLKLEPGKAQVETLVIDRMQRPSAN